MAESGGGWVLGEGHPAPTQPARGLSSGVWDAAPAENEYGAC